MTRRTTDAQTDAMLDELESIRVLLGEDPKEALNEGSGEKLSEGLSQVSEEAAVEAGHDVEAPLLDDVLGGGLTINEDFLTDMSLFGREREEFPGLDEAMIKALIGEEWRESARRIMREARETIGQDQQGEFDDANSGFTSGLTDALRARIDATVDQWLHTLVADNIAELRERLGDALADELRHLIHKDGEKASGR